MKINKYYADTQVGASGAGEWVAPEELMNHNRIENQPRLKKTNHRDDWTRLHAHTDQTLGSSFNAITQVYRWSACI